MMKKVLIALGGLFGVILLALVGISLYVRTLLTPEFVVEQVESALNCRMELTELNVGLFSGAKIELRGLAIGPRDAVANKGTPLKERKAMGAKTISVESVDVSFQLLPLFSKKLVLEKFVFTKPVINLVLYANGRNNLGALFDTPRVVGGKRNPALDAPKEAEEPAEPGSDQPFRAQDLPIAGTLKKVGIDDGTLNLTLNTGDRVQAKAIDLFLKDIDVDPTDLANHNSAYLSFDSDVTVTSRVRNTAVARFLLSSAGQIVPFDPKTGLVNPAVRYKVKMKESSYVTGFAVMDQLSGDLPALESAGVKMNDLAKQLDLIKDVDIDIEYGRSLVKFMNDPTFPTRHYDIALLKGSEMRLADSTHKFRGSVLGDQEETNKAFLKVDRELERALKGSGNAVEIRNKAFASILKDGRIRLDFTSAGALSNPNVDLLVNLPEITDIIKSAGGDIVKGRIDQELRKVLPGGAGKAGEDVKDALNKLF